MGSSFLSHLGTNQCGSPTLSFLAWLEMRGQVFQIYLMPSVPLPQELKSGIGTILGIFSIESVQGSRECKLPWEIIPTIS